MSRLARGLAIVAAAAALVSTTSGCDYVTRKQEAKLLVDAANRAETSRTALGVIQVSMRAEKLTPQYAAFLTSKRVAYVPVYALFAFDKREARSNEVHGANGLAFPEAVFSGPVVYLKRPVAAGATDSQFGFRAWSRLDFSKVGKKDSNKLTQPNAVNPINPTYLVRMLAGTLSGSVKQLGTTTIDGVATKHFRMNVDRSKAFRGLSDKDHQAVDKAFASDNISGGVYKKAETWIDADGLPRRLVLRVKQKLDQDNVFAITYQIDLTKFGTRLAILKPKASNTATVPSLNALLNSAVNL